MKYMCALIVVEDVEKSRYFYEKILGQKVKADFGENVVFEGDFAIHQRAHYRMLIDNREINTQSNNFELYFEEDVIPPVIEKLKGEGVEFVHDLREQPWRQQVVRFYDYDGNIVEIGESLEHTAFRLFKEDIPVGKISEITYLPVEAVRKAIEQYSLCSQRT